MTRGQECKKVMLLLLLASLAFLGMFFSKSTTLVSRAATSRTASSTIQDDYPVLLVPAVPDSYPSNMLKLAMVPRNKTMPTTNAMTITDSCLVTSQVRLVLSEPQWILQSLDIHGNSKTVCGDEYYVTYTDYASENQPTAAAIVRDLRDGSYQLRFVTVPLLDTTTTILSGTGNITIYLQYSCGIGHLAPPAKQNWSTGGAINARYVVDNVKAPLMQTFVPPNNNHKINLKNYKRVICYGDSTMGQFVESRGKNLVWPDNVGAPLTTDTVQFPRKKTKGGKKKRPCMIDEITLHVSKAIAQFGNDNVALVIGSGVWDILADDDAIQGSLFVDHRQALRHLILAIRRQFPNLYIYWKSLTAMHIHQVASKKDWFHLDRVFYMSSSRSFDLYRYQREIMRDLNVTLLDLFPAAFLSSHELAKDDGRHYSHEFNRKMLSWFYECDDDNESDTKQ